MKNLETMPVKKQWVLTGTLLEFAESGEFDLVRSILEVLLTDTEEKLQHLDQALGNGDVPSAQRIAHSLKGATRQVGIDELANAAERLEHHSPDTDLDDLFTLARQIHVHWNQARESIRVVRDSLGCLTM